MSAPLVYGKITLSVQGEMRFYGASRVHVCVFLLTLRPRQVEGENTARVAFKPHQAYCPLYTEGIHYFGKIQRQRPDIDLQMPDRRLLKRQNMPDSGR